MPRVLVSRVTVLRVVVLRVVVLLAAFAAALGLRVAVGGPGVAQSRAAGLVFAGCLLALAGAAGARLRPGQLRAGQLRPGQLLAGPVLVGLAGGGLICLPVTVAALVAHRPWPAGSGFWPWAAAVTVVATAEEVFLRGALYDAVEDLAGRVAAVAVAAAAFAVLHVPLYGWQVLPLDLSVGVVLGMLRARTGTVTAPAVAHVGADWAGWFLR